MQNSTDLQSAGIRVRVSDLLFALQKRWMIIVALSLIGLVFGLILSAMTYVQSSFQSYEVSGSFAVTTLNGSGLYINNSSAANNNDYHLAEDMMDAVKYIIQSDRVMNDVINQEKLLGYTAKNLKSAIRLTQYNTTQIMEMSFTWRNAEESVSIWNAIVESASRLMPQTLQLGSLAVVNEAQAELVGVGGSGNNLPVLLTMLGFAAGVGYALIELLMHPTLNNVKDVETMLGLETIGVIPRDNAYYKKRSSLLVKEEGGTSIVEQNYSAAAYILRNRLGSREQHHCFYVTSAVSQEGKSTVAANLAIQLSDMEHRTLLIDFDTRNPSLGSLFLENVDYARSLNALYAGEATEEEAITTLTGYLDILPAVLAHNVMMMDGTIVDLFRRLCEKYEYVILDAPPVGQVSDTLSLNQIASTVLFVIGYDTSTIPEIQNALEKLDKSGIRVLGCIVNGVQSSKNAFDYGADARGDKKQRVRKNRGEKEDLFTSIEESQEQGQEGDAKAPKPQRKKLFSSKKKKETGKKSKAKETGEAVPQQPRKNVMDDLLLQEEKQDALTDTDAVSALLKSGIEGNWGDAENKENAEANGESEEPAALEPDVLEPAALEPAEEESPAVSAEEDGEEEEKDAKPQRKPLIFSRKKREAKKEPETQEDDESEVRQPDEELIDGEETGEEEPEASKSQQRTAGLLKSLFFPGKKPEAEKKPEAQEADESDVQEPDEDLMDDEAYEEEKQEAPKRRGTVAGLLRSLFSPRKREDEEEAPEDDEDAGDGEDTVLPSRKNVKDFLQRREDQVTDQTVSRQSAANQFSDKEKLFAAIREKQQKQAKAEEENSSGRRREAYSARKRQEETENQPEGGPAAEGAVLPQRKNPMEDLLHEEAAYDVPARWETAPVPAETVTESEGDGRENEEKADGVAEQPAWMQIREKEQLFFSVMREKQKQAREKQLNARSAEHTLPEIGPESDWEEKENEEAADLHRKIPPVIRGKQAVPAEEESTKHRERSRRAIRPDKPKS